MIERKTFWIYLYNIRTVRKQFVQNGNAIESHMTFFECSSWSETIVDFKKVDFVLEEDDWMWSFFLTYSNASLLNLECPVSASLSLKNSDSFASSWVFKISKTEVPRTGNKNQIHAAFTFSFCAVWRPVRSHQLWKQMTSVFWGPWPPLWPRALKLSWDLSPVWARAKNLWKNGSCAASIQVSCFLLSFSSQKAMDIHFWISKFDNWHQNSNNFYIL